MAILCLKYIYGGKDNNYQWLSLIRCEHPAHLGNRERLIRKPRGIPSRYTKFCGSCTRLGEKHTPEHIEKVASALRGKTHTEQAKKNMSAGKKGCVFTEEHKKKLSIAHAGVPWSDKQRANIPKSLCRREAHHHWNDKLTDEERLHRRKIVAVKEWRDKVFKRDNYICQISTKTGKGLIAHHLDGWNKFPEKRFDVDNGITISKQYHEMFHKIYGKGNNTREQFEEFLTFCSGNENSYIEV